MLLIMLLMYTTSHAKIRQQCFEAFWYTHHLVSGLAARALCRGRSEILLADRLDPRFARLMRTKGLD